MMKKIMTALITFLLSATLAQAFFFTNPMIDKPAPDFTLTTTLNGEESMTQARAGKKAILFFWATWCPYCRQVKESFHGDISHFAEQGIELIAVNVGEGGGAVTKYLKKVDLEEMNVFLDKSQETAELYGVNGLPTFVFIDEKGMVKDVSNSLPDHLDQMF